MQYKKKIQSEIDFTKTFRLIAQSYEEIAVMKMRKVRNSVLRTREYLTKLSEIYFDIKRAQKRELEKAQKKIKDSKGKIEGKPFDLAQGKPAKTVSVFLSANTSLYGDLISRIFKDFVEKTSKDNSDIIIIGRVGRRLYDEYAGKKKYQYFELPDFEITVESLKPVIFHLVAYQKILVYYGKFESIVNQLATISNVTGDQPFAQIEKPNEGANETLGTDFLFEPGLETILTFFQDLITTSLFRQTVHETQLARLASRIMSMEKAQQNVAVRIKKLHFIETKLHRQQEQNKQINRLSGISLWKR